MDEIKYDVFLNGTFVDLICLDENVVNNSNWYNWFNDEKTTKYMQKHYFPNTKVKQLNFYKTEIENNKSIVQLGILHKNNNVLIGIISLKNIDYINRRCEISGLIGEKQYKNLKYIVEACQLIIKHAFDQLNINKVYGGTIIRELSQIFCRILGFKEEGIKRKEVYKNGEYRDIFLVGLLREEYYEKIRNCS